MTTGTGRRSAPVVRLHPASADSKPPRPWPARQPCLGDHADWAWNSCETPGRDKIRRHLTLAVTLTHEAENGTNTPALLARSRYASVRSLERYAPSGPEAVARHVVFRWKYRESVTALAYEPAVPSMNAPVLASMNTTRYEGAFSAGSPGGGPAEGARKPGGMVRETAQASA